MPQPNDLSRSLVVLEQDSTLVAVIEMSQSSWLVAGVVPGIERHPLKKLAADEQALLRLLRRWQNEAGKAGHPIQRTAVAFEAGRDGFWLARWLWTHDIEAYVVGVGIETADMLTHEVLSRDIRDRRAVARYAGITGSPDESGRKRREARQSW
jgi:transposase